MYHLVRLNSPIPKQNTATSGLNRSPMTAALRIIPRNPFLCDSINFGQIALTYEAVQMKNSTTMIMESNEKKAL